MLDDMGQGGSATDASYEADLKHTNYLHARLAVLISRPARASRESLDGVVMHRRISERFAVTSSPICCKQIKWTLSSEFRDAHFSLQLC